MGCGIGACLGCAVEMKSDGNIKYGHVCKQGPVFYANEAKELVLYVRVGAEGCESSDWAKYQFTAPTIDVAIDEVENGNGNVSVYPTLSDGTFFISFNSQASADVTVYDVNGSIVTKMNDVANNTPIQLSQKGLYKIEVELDGKKTVKSVVIY